MNGRPTSLVWPRLGCLKRNNGVKPFDEVRHDIREYLQSKHVTDIMQAVTKLSNDLRSDSKISAFPENLH